MAQSLSFLEKYGHTGFAWVVKDGRLQVESMDAPPVIFGKETVNLEDKGRVARLEAQHVAARKNLYFGKVIETQPRNFVERIQQVYRRQIAFEEEGPRKQWLMKAVEGNNTSFLENILRDIQPAEIYLGVNGTLYGLSGSGSFRFGQRSYSPKKICSTARVYGLHEKVLQKNLRSFQNFFGVESQVLSSVDVALDGTHCRGRLTLEPFAMRTYKGLFGFDRCVAEYGFTVKENAAAFTTVPRIISPNDYIHPFVFSNNSICFNGFQRWEDADLPLGVPFSKNIVEEKIAFVAAETARMLRRGYTNMTTPARNLDTCRKIGERDALREGLVMYGSP